MWIMIPMACWVTRKTDDFESITKDSSEVEYTDSSDTSDTSDTLDPEDDSDGDGFATDNDCNDSNPAVGSCEVYDIALHASRLRDRVFGWATPIKSSPCLLSMPNDMWASYRGKLESIYSGGTIGFRVVRSLH